MFKSEIVKCESRECMVRMVSGNLEILEEWSRVSGKFVFMVKSSLYSKNIIIVTTPSEIKNEKWDRWMDVSG